MSQTPNNFGKGCLAFIVITILACVFMLVLINITGLHWSWLFFGSWLFLNFLSKKIFAKQHTTNSYRFGKISGMIVFILIVFGLYNLSVSSDDVIVDTFDNDELVEAKYLVTPNDSIKVLAHNRQWKDYYGESYTSEFMVREIDYLELRTQLDQFRQRSYETFWGDLYGYMSTNDDNALDLVYNSFANIKRANNLNAREFADMVVTMVQDMPYALVFEGECLAPENYEESFAQILRQCPECCIGNKRFGIQNPVSFLANLKGDCDTRTVLIFTILSHFGYDIAILNSDFYKHSILGINLPTKGTYKAYRGKKYYVWETTAQNYMSGTLPYGVNDINQWHVVLTNN